MTSPCNLTPLTEEQRELAAKNVSLARWYAGRAVKIGVGDFDELFSDMQHCLLLAARTFDPKESTFSTWASYYMRGVLHHRKRVRERKPPPTTVSFQIEDSGAESETLVPHYEDRADDSLDIFNELKKLKIPLNPEYRKVIELLCQGLTQLEVGQRLGKTRQYAHFVISRIRDMVESRIEHGHCAISKNRGSRKSRTARPSVGVR